MKSAPAQLATHLAQEVTTICSLWEVTRVDGVVLRITDHDDDLTFEGNVFLCSSGWTRSAIASGADISADNLQIQGFLDSELITEADMRAGKYRSAEVKAYIVNWQHPEHGAIKYKYGKLGEVDLNAPLGYTVEFRGLIDSFRARVGEQCSPTCRADFGDSRCKFNVETLRQAGTVTSVTSSKAFACAGYLTGDLTVFNNSLLTWTGGQNQDRKQVVKTCDSNGNLVLFLAAPFTISVGDTFTIIPYCKKTREACKAYGNLNNMRGEPDVPGENAILDYPNVH